MHWLVLYADGSTFTSKDGSPVDVPRQAVQAVLMEDDLVGVRHEVSKIGKWGWWREEWRGFEDLEGWYDYLVNAKPVIPLFGRTLPDAEWHQLMFTKSELMFGIKKYGWHEYERHFDESA